MAVFNRKEYKKLWYPKHRNRINKLRRKHRRENRKAYAKAFKIYYRKNRQRIQTHEHNRRKRVKAEVFAAYGGKCMCCAEAEQRFLTIDHIFGKGREHRRKLKRDGFALYLWLKRLGFPKDRFQLLCYNCNCGRARNNGVCPHKEVCTVDREQM